MQQKFLYPIYSINLFLLTVVLAALYIIFAKIGFLLALPPGNVTAFWPPSGFALAAMIFFGWQAALGIWVGSCAVNIWTINGELSAQISTTIALGSSIQAIVCAYGLRKAAEFNTRFHRNYPLTSDILNFIVVCAVSCTIAASIGIGSLLIGEMIPAKQTTLLWSTWWLGDYAGMLFITPCILVIYHLKQRSIDRHFLLTAVPKILLGAVLIAFALTWQFNANSFQRTLNSQALEVKNAVEKPILTSITQMELFGEFIYQTPDLDNNSFQEKARQLLLDNPSITALSWTPRINRANISQHNALAKREGMENFQIYQFDSSGKKIDPIQIRNTFYPIFYIAPEVSNSGIRGFDNSSEANRLATLNLARDSGKIAATGLIKPLQNTDKNNFILFFQPVYQRYEVLNAAAISIAPTKTMQRRSTIRGFAVGLINLEGLLSTTLKINKSSNIQLWEITNSSKPTLLASTIQTKNPRETISSSATFNVANRTWRIAVYPTEQQLSDFNQLNAWLIAGIGISIIILIITRIFYLEKMSWQSGR